MNLNGTTFWYFSFSSFHLGQVQTVDGHRIEFIISARGRIQLVIDDFPFCQNDKQEKKTYYICCQSKVLKFVQIGQFIEFWLISSWFISMSISFICNRCPARARLVHMTNRVEIKKLVSQSPINDWTSTCWRIAENKTSFEA